MFVSLPRRIPPAQDVWHPAFITAYAELGNITDAARQAGVNRSTFWRAKTSDPEFAELYEDAEQQAADTLEREARRRAVEGTDEPVFYKGEQVGTIRKYSDVLLIFLLKALRPEKYRERFMLPPGELDRAIERELAIARGEVEATDETQTVD